MKKRQGRRKKEDDNEEAKEEKEESGGRRRIFLTKEKKESRGRCKKARRERGRERKKMRTRTLRRKKRDQQQGGTGFFNEGKGSEVTRETWRKKNAVKCYGNVDSFFRLFYLHFSDKKKVATAKERKCLRGWTKKNTYN